MMTLANRRVLYISYTGMLDALGQSQVIPYLRELSNCGVRFTLLSFEQDAAFSDDGRTRCEELRQRLAESHIEWHWLRYHKRPSLPATIYDVAKGTRYAQKLVYQNRIEMVHARSHIAATIALALKNRFNLRVVFDLRGLMAEEYVDANHWRKGSIPYRLTKSMESRALSRADGIVTLTESIWSAIKDWNGLRNRDVIHEVVPCCADLELFRFSGDERLRQRNKLGLHDRFILVYSGSVGGWYLTDRMVDFFVELKKIKPNSYFLWVTGGPRDLIEKLMLDRGVSPNEFGVFKVAPADVPEYLCASDLGIAFYKPSFSRLATSPVKVAEYLACGLPVIINSGVGDSDRLIATQGVGGVVEDFDATEYRKALSIIEAFTPDEMRVKARIAAECYYDVRTVGLQRYAALYEKVLNRK